MNDFLGYLKDYAAVVTSGLSGALLALISYLSGLSPPVVGMAQITATYQIVILILVYQIFDKRQKTIADRWIKFAGGAFSVIAVIYLFTFFSLTFLDTDGNRELKGLVCTAKAIRQYADECPLLNTGAINAAGNIQTDLWTDLGLNSSMILLVFMWLLFFSSVSLLVAVFVNFQRKPNV